MNVTTFGAFVEILPGVNGLLHVSEMDTVRTDLSYYKEGMLVDVKLTEVRQQRL